MRRFGTLLLPLLLSALACSTLQSFSTPEPVWTYSNESIHNNGFTPLLQTDESGNIYTYLTSEGFSVNGLLGLNGKTGQELWSSIINEDLTELKGVYGNWVIFRETFTDEVSSDSMVLFTVVAYNLQTGKEAWRYVGVPENASIHVSGNYVFARKSSTEMDILDLQSGNIISTYILDIDPAEYTDLSAGWIRFLYTQTAFFALSPAGVLREYSLPNAELTRSVTLDVPYYIDAYLIQDGILYLYAGYEIGSDTSLIAYNLASGQKLWELTGLYGTSQEIQFHNGLGYLNTAQGASALNLRTGQILWSVGGSLYGPFLINEQTDGKLLVAQDNSLSAYDASTGEKAWAFEPGLENTLQLSAEEGTAFVTSGDDPPAFQSGVLPSRLDAIDIATGESIWRFEQPFITLPVRAGALLVVAYERGVTAFPTP